MGDINDYLPLWGQWNIEELIGEGTDCKVYRAVSADGSERCAIKQYTVAPTDDPAQAERRARALLALADRQIALRGKPNLAEYYERQPYHRPDGSYDVFVRMELLTSLRSVMSKTEFSEAMLAQLGQDTCAALAALEDAGTCHGALHPGNIFLSRNGSYKLGDYCRSGSRTITGKAREYIAPEVLTGSSLPSAGADRYALGMVLYRLCNGLRGPFLPTQDIVSRQDIAQADRRRIRGEVLPAPENGSSRISAILRRACAPDPDRRYSSTDEMLHDFLLLQDPDAEIMQPETADAEPKAAPAKKKFPVFAAGITAAIVLLIAACVTAWALVRAQQKKEVPAATETRAATTVQTEAPATEVLTTEVPETAAPTTETPTTEAPTTEEPTTEAPSFVFVYDSTYNFVDFDIPASGYVIADSDTRYITTDDLKGMTANQCRLACNEIFARKGRIFTSKTISDYFNAMPWYEGTVEGSYFDSHQSTYLTDIEVANASTILRYERSMGWQ